MRKLVEMMMGFDVGDLGAVQWNLDCGKLELSLTRVKWMFRKVGERGRLEEVHKHNRVLEE
jgi:hypothetical protein